MPPAFQGIINKWVKINNKNHSDAMCTSSNLKVSSDKYGSKSFVYPNRKQGEDYTINTSDETATFDSSLNYLCKPNIIKLESNNNNKVQNTNKSSSYSSRISRKLSNSNSHTDNLRKKRADSIPIAQDYEEEEKKDADGEYLGVSVEELFNPLATHPRNFYQDRSSLTNGASYHEEQFALDKHHNDSCKQSNALQDRGNCKKVNVKIQEFIKLKEFLESKKDTNCELCRKTIENALKELNSTSGDSSCDTVSAIPASSSLPIQISKQEKSPDYQVGESIALMESSQRLLDFMNLHKTRINQLKHDNESKQKKLNAKLSEFSILCQMIRNEISETRDESVSKNAHNMILQLEEEISKLKAEHVGINDLEAQRSIIHQDAELYVSGCDIHNILHEKLNSDESEVTSCLSDSDASHESQELVFSLDDEF